MPCVWEGVFAAGIVLYSPVDSTRSQSFESCSQVLERYRAISAACLHFDDEMSWDAFNHVLLLSSCFDGARQARRKQALEPTMNEWEQVEIQDLCMSSSQRCETG